MRKSNVPSARAFLGASVLLALSVGGLLAEDDPRDLVVRRSWDHEIAISKEQLALAEKKLGPKHPIVASVLENIAKMYRAQGSYADAEPHYKRALAIREKALGPDHPDVVQSIQALASLYELQGRFDEAAPLYKRLRAIREKTSGQESSGASPKN